MIELKNCPFCGGKAKLDIKRNSKSRAWFVFAMCEECLSIGHSIYLGPIETVEDAEKAKKKIEEVGKRAARQWNRRVQMTDNTPTIEKCENPHYSKPTTDLISRADAIRTIKEIKCELGWVCCVAIEALPSADAVIVRPKYMMHKSDYEKWAEEVKKESSNIIVLPYDAEVITDDRLDVDRIYCSPQIADSVVRVVRCKDCRHWVGNGLLWDGEKGKIPPLQMCWDNSRADDYCSYGERAEQTDDTDEIMAGMYRAETEEKQTEWTPCNKWIGE